MNEEDITKDHETIQTNDFPMEYLCVFKESATTPAELYIGEFLLTLAWTSMIFDTPICVALLNNGVKHPLSYYIISFFLTFLYCHTKLYESYFEHRFHGSHIIYLILYYATSFVVYCNYTPYNFNEISSKLNELPAWKATIIDYFEFLKSLFAWLFIRFTATGSWILYVLLIALVFGIKGIIYKKFH